jgi:hypothetical protein
LNPFVASSSDQLASCELWRMADPPGYVLSAAMDPGGNNRAFVVLKNCPAQDEQKAERIQESRHALMLKAVEGVEDEQVLVEIRSRSSAHWAHRFIVQLRAPRLLAEMNLEEMKVDLQRFHDETVRDLVEFMYTDSCESFRSMEHDFTDEVASMSPEDYAEITEAHERQLSRTEQLAKSVGFGQLQRTASALLENLAEVSGA